MKSQELTSALHKHTSFWTNLDPFHGKKCLHLWGNNEIYCICGNVGLCRPMPSRFALLGLVFARHWGVIDLLIIIILFIDENFTMEANSSSWLITRNRSLLRTFWLVLKNYLNSSLLRTKNSMSRGLFYSFLYFFQLSVWVPVLLILGCSPKVATYPHILSPLKLIAWIRGVFQVFSHVAQILPRGTVNGSINIFCSWADFYLFCLIAHPIHLCENISSWSTYYFNEYVLSISFYQLKCWDCCCLTAKLHLPLCDPTDCSPPGFSVHGFSQATILR